MTVSFSSRRGMASVALLIAAGCHGSNPTPAPPARSLVAPEAWSPGEYDRYFGLNQKFDGGTRVEGAGEHGIITGTTGPLAIHAGLNVLRSGGSAADAVIATSLAQITLAAGSWVSFAGFLNGLYYDAASGKVYALNGAFAIPKEETDPLTIPRGAVVVGTPSGRTALVPGYLAGIQALHDRFGKLPFATLFEPALYLADHGIPVSASYEKMLEGRRNVLSRLPETKAVYFKPDGSGYTAGEVFRQPALAATLRRVAREGAAYVYRGDWARRAVDVIRREGGKLSLEDLASYRAIWAEPIGIDYRGYRVLATPRPNFGGTATLAAMNLLELANLPEAGRPVSSAQSLYRLIQAIIAPDALGFFLGDGRPSPLVQRHLGPIDLSDAGLLGKPGARSVWSAMRSPKWGEFMEAMRAEGPASSGGSAHSDAVVAVDQRGNFAVITHTINTVLWGTTGINIDGVSIPDAASFQQAVMKAAIDRAGPGARLPDPTNPVMVLKDGRPVIGGSSIGAGLFPATIQSLVYLLDFGLGPQAAVDAPQFIGSAGYATGRERFSIVVPANVFPDSVLAQVRALGQPIAVGPGTGAGTWTVAMIDPVTHRLRAGTHSRYNGIAEGF
jgi:gamma-glutamyltranspeptidase/glutathione hydrolase